MCYLLELNDLDHDSYLLDIRVKHCAMQFPGLRIKDEEL